MEHLDLKITNNTKHLNKLENINPRFDKSEKQKLAKAAKDFESLLTSMMLKSMNKTNGGLFGESGFGADVLDTVFYDEMSQHMTRQKGFGVAEMIYKKVTGEEFSPDLIQKRISNPKIKADYSAIKKFNSITPSRQSSGRLKDYDPIIKSMSGKYGVDSKLIRSIILTESAANPTAVSSANAKGLMQLIDSTAADMGVKDVFDPKQNIEGGTKYISRMLNKYDGDIEKALAAYNAGPGNVDKYDGIPPFKETQNYVARVLGYLKNMDI